MRDQLNSSHQRRTDRITLIDHEEEEEEVEGRSSTTVIVAMAEKNDDEGKSDEDIHTDSEVDEVELNELQRCGRYFSLLDRRRGKRLPQQKQPAVIYRVAANHIKKVDTVSHYQSKQDGTIMSEGGPFLDVVFQWHAPTDGSGGERSSYQVPLSSPSSSWMLTFGRNVVSPAEYGQDPTLSVVAFALPNEISSLSASHCAVLVTSTSSSAPTPCANSSHYGIAVIDLDSRNGTWCNGTRLLPRTPYIVQAATTSSSLQEEAGRETRLQFASLVSGLAVLVRVVTTRGSTECAGAPRGSAIATGCLPPAVLPLPQLQQKTTTTPLTTAATHFQPVAPTPALPPVSSVRVTSADVETQTDVVVALLRTDGQQTISATATTKGKRKAGGKRQRQVEEEEEVLVAAPPFSTTTTSDAAAVVQSRSLHSKKKARVEVVVVADDSDATGGPVTTTTTGLAEGTPLRPSRRAVTRTQGLDPSPSQKRPPLGTPTPAGPLTIVTSGIRLSSDEAQCCQNLGLLVNPPLSQYHTVQYIVAEGPLVRSVKLLSALPYAREILQRAWLDAVMASGRVAAPTSRYHYSEVYTRRSIEAVNQFRLEALMHRRTAQDRQQFFRGLRFLLHPLAKPQDEPSNHLKYVVTASGGEVVDGDAAARSIVDVMVLPNDPLSAPEQRQCAALVRRLQARQAEEEKDEGAVGVLLVTVECVFRAVLQQRPLTESTVVLIEGGGHDAVTPTRGGRRRT